MYTLPAAFKALLSRRLLPGAFLFLLLLLGCNPVIIIEHPEEGASFAYGEAITFSCTAMVLPEGLLGGDAIIWTSSLDGEIGRGASFSRNDLREGWHEITARATDPSGMFSQAGISIQVGAVRPQAAIASPGEGATFQLGETILFSGYARDPREGDLPDAALAWASDRDGSIGTGSDFEADNLTAGQHVITLTATNSQGVSGSAAVTIAIATTATTTLAPAPPETSSTTSSSTISTTTSTTGSTTTSSAPSTSTTSSAASTTSSSSSTTSLTNWIEMPGGSGSNLNALWGTSADEVYAVGQQGRLLRYDGNVWTELTSPTTYDLNKIFGTSSATIAAVGNGGVLSYTLNGASWSAAYIADSIELNAVWIAPTGEIFIAGDKGTLLHSTNSGLTWPVMDSGTLLELNDMWSASETEIYAVGGSIAAGGSSIIIKYNGSSWNQAYTNKNDNETFYGIWGALETDIFAVGGRYPPDSGVVMHYDGSNWSYMDISSSWFLYGVWGSSPVDVYAVGGDKNAVGAIFHYDGSAWRLVGTVGRHLNAIWGTSSTDIYAVGNGVILKYAPE